MKNLWILCFAIVYGVSLAGCNNNTSDTQSSESNTFKLVSNVMKNNGTLPVAYTCDGNSVNPPLSWSGAPKGTKYYALIMHHNAPDGVHWYWNVYNINASTSHINSGQNLADIKAELGSNSVNNLNQYAPPCSKGPGEKRYTYTVYALSDAINFAKNTQVDRATLLKAIKNITLDSAQMTVTYERAGSPHKPARKKPKVHESIKTPLSLVNSAPPVDLTALQSSRCNTIKSSVNNAGFSKNARVTCDNQYAYIVSNTYPEHPVMTGITGTNEQVPVPAKNYAAPIKLAPEKAKKLTTIDAALGVAVNGVPIYDYSSQGELNVNQYDAKHDTLKLGQLDNCGGHAGRGDDYHYHVAPTCMIDTMKNQSSDAIIGWAYDGYPLYGNKNPDGSTIAKNELDVCNGQSDSKFGYRYHTSKNAPYIFQCLVGEVDTRVLPRVAPLSGDTQGIRSQLKPPVGGVTNLTHTVGEDGSRTMRYTYKNEQYFTTYSPSKQGDDCFDFKQKTISNKNGIQTGTFCRGQQPQAKKLSQNNPEARFKLEAWADNWFAAYIGDKLLIEDSVPITTERSFNAESINFSASYPIQLNFIIKDFKQNNTGLEYIGTRRQQMGDGGFIMQITDTKNNKIVAVSNKTLKCEVLHKAPLDKTCENSQNPTAGIAPCKYMAKEAPRDWLKSNFDDSTWPNATEHTTSSVSPKDGFDDINWDKTAQFIWGSDLETDNTLICRVTINEPH